MQKFEESSLKERRVDQTRVDAEGLVEELLASTDLKPVEQEECKRKFLLEFFSNEGSQILCTLIDSSCGHGYNCLTEESVMRDSSNFSIISLDR